MSIASNLVYLEDEYENVRRRIEQIIVFLKENSHVSIYQRRINNKLYVYKKFRKGSRSISEYMGKAEALAPEIFEEINHKNQLIKKARSQLALERIELKAIEKQLRIVRKAYEYERNSRDHKTA